MAAPRLDVPEAVHDFGTVDQGVPVKFAFRVRNVGDEPLRVENVKSSCGCTIGVATGRDVPPGDYTYITVNLDTARLSGRTTRAVTVYTNDPATPVQPLALTGDVRSDLVLSPTPLYFGHVVMGQAVRREIVVRPGRPGGADVVSFVDSEDSALRARLDAGPEPGTQRVVVDVSPDLPPGRFDGEVRLRTTSASNPVITVPVFGMVESDVALLPPQVTFGVSRAGMPSPLEVHIRNRARRPMAVTKVVAPPQVDAELRTVRAGVEWRLVLRLREVPADRKLDTAVEIFTDQPRVNRLVVPVYAIDRG
jgi:hypothetical protein